jgi:hypothetical protein
MVNHFTLFAHGQSFDVDAFLNATTLRFDEVWRRGDQPRYSCIESPYKTSGVEVVLGDGRTIPFLEQDGVAIEYLEAHRNELRAVAKFPGVETFILGLQYHVRLEEGLTGFCMGPSPRLMWHALDIGVRPTYYVTFDRPYAADEVDA